MKKRVFDVLLSGTLLVALTPVYAGLYAAIRIGMGKPVLFTQERVGLHYKPFSMYKFRTMHNAHDAQGNLLPPDKRVTGLGRILRRLGLDELPQIYNVFKGDMSFVGPRPQITTILKERETEHDEYTTLHLAKPGLTSPAHIPLIYKPEGISLREKLKLDWEYASKPPSLRRDLSIIFATVPVVVLGHRDISLQGLSSLDHDRK